MAEMAAEAVRGLVIMIADGPPVGPAVAAMILTIGPGIALAEAWKAVRHR